LTLQRAQLDASIKELRALRDASADTLEA
jgi:hypothetical protein